MSGRFVVLVVAAIGWLIAAVVAYAIVSLFGFFGVGFFGLLLLFISTQVELESEAGARLFAPQAQARQNMPARSVPPGVTGHRRPEGPPASSEALESA